MSNFEDKINEIQNSDKSFNTKQELEKTLKKNDKSANLIGSKRKKLNQLRYEDEDDYYESSSESYVNLRINKLLKNERTSRLIRCKECRKMNGRAKAKKCRMCENWSCNLCTEKIMGEAANVPDENWFCLDCQEISLKSYEKPIKNEIANVVEPKNFENEKDKYENVIQIEEFLIYEKEISESRSIDLSEKVKGIDKKILEILKNVKNKELNQKTMKNCLICLVEFEYNNLLKFKTLNEFIYFLKFCFESENQKYLDNSNEKVAKNKSTFFNYFKNYEKHKGPEYVFKNVNHVCENCFKNTFNEDEGFSKLFNLLHLSSNPNTSYKADVKSKPKKQQDVKIEKKEILEKIPQKIEKEQVVKNEVEKKTIQPSKNSEIRLTQNISLNYNNNSQSNKEISNPSQITIQNNVSNNIYELKNKIGNLLNNNQTSDNQTNLNNSISKLTELLNNFKDNVTDRRSNEIKPSSETTRIIEVNNNNKSIINILDELKSQVSSMQDYSNVQKQFIKSLFNNNLSVDNINNKLEPNNQNNIIGNLLNKNQDISKNSILNQINSLLLNQNHPIVSNNNVRVENNNNNFLLNQNLYPANPHLNQFQQQNTIYDIQKLLINQNNFAPINLNQNKDNEKLIQLLMQNGYINQNNLMNSPFNFNQPFTHQNTNYNFFENQLNTNGVQNPFFNNINYNSNVINPRENNHSLQAGQINQINQILVQLQSLVPNKK